MGRDIRGISCPVPPTNPRDSELAANGVAVSYTLKMPEIIIRNRFTKLHLYGVFFVGCTRISKAWLTLNNPRPIFSHHTDRKIQPLRKSRLAHVHAHSPKGTYCRFHLTRITVKAWSGTVFKTAAWISVSFRSVHKLMFVLRSHARIHGRSKWSEIDSSMVIVLALTSILSIHGLKTDARQVYFPVV